MSAIDLSGLTRRFAGHTVLHGIDLAVRRGEFLSLLGPSGCGKSTILRLVAGLDAPDGGSIHVDGRDVTHLAAKQRDIAMVFQSYALYPYLSVAQNIAVPLEMRQMSRWQRLPLLGPWWPGARAARQAIDARVRAAASLASIEPLLARKPAQLSGGQRQRVALARALVREPKAFLLDEPLSNLDAHLRLQMRHEIASLHRRLGTTFVYVTHDQEEAMALSDRIAVMHEGRVLQVDTPRALYARPASLAVARFIGEPGINLLVQQGAADASGGVAVSGQAQPLRTRTNHGLHTLGFRPESIRLGHGAQDEPALRLQVRLDHCEYLGGQQLAVMHAPDGTTLRGTWAASVALPAGEELAVHIALADLLAFDAEGRRIDLDALRAAPAGQPQGIAA